MPNAAWRREGMKLTRIIACACLLALVAVPVRAQFVQSPDDRGAADTLDMIISVSPDATTNQLKMQADIWVAKTRASGNNKGS